MEELIVNNAGKRKDGFVSVFWGNLDIETIQIEEFNSGKLVSTINVTDFYSKYQMKALQVGHYRVFLEVKYRGIIQKEMRVI